MGERKAIGIVIISVMVITILITMLIQAVNNQRINYSNENSVNENTQNKENNTTNQDINLSDYVDYKPQTNRKLEDLPQNYNEIEAARDGCFVITNNNKIYNKDKLDSFILRTGIYGDNSTKDRIRLEDSIRIVQYSTKGEPIITDIEYKIGEEGTGKYIMTLDTSRSNANKLQINDDIPGSIYTIIPSEGEDRTTIYLARYAENIIEGVEGKEPYKDIEICSYSKDVIVGEAYPSFYGKVVEAQQTVILVEPFETSKMGGDRISVDLGQDNDAIYSVGTNVKITYTGIVKESYPAQIDVVKIELKSEDSFDLIFEQAEGEAKTEKIIDKTKNEKYDYDIYTYGGNFKILINGQILELKDALLNGKITMDEIIAKANNDYSNRNIMAAAYLDGGSVIYKYPNYSIIKYHKLGGIDETSGNRDVYIGSIALQIF